MNSIDTVFEWLLAATLRASVLAVVILGIQWVLRHRLPAAWRHALWLPVLVVLVLPVLPEVPFGLFPRKTAAPAPETLVVAGQRLVQTDTTAAIMAIEATPLPPRIAIPSASGITTGWNPYAIAWLAGALGFMAAGIIGHRRNLRRIQLGATAPDRNLQTAIDAAALEVRLKRAPQAMVSPSVTSPAVTGFARPLLLLPAGFPEGFTAAEARLILLHEFSHLKRLDLPLNWLICLLQALHWFNPLLWFAFARMRADREAACDARVLSIDATDRRAEYGGALLKLQSLTPSRALSLGFIGIFERGSEIKARIRGISAHRPGHFVWQATGGTILTLLMLFGVTKGQQTVQSPAGTETVLANDPALPINDAAKKAILEKLNSIIIPRIDFKDTTIEEAVDFLRLRAMELDASEPDPAKKGINLVVVPPPQATAEGQVPVPPRIGELKLRNVPLGRALQYICEITRLRYTVDDTAVILAPRKEGGATGQSTDELEKAIEKQAAKVEEHRKRLSDIVRSKGIIYIGPDSPKNQDARSALQVYHGLEQQKMQLESQIKSLLKYDNEQLMVYASGLDLPDNAVRKLYPEYLETKRELEAFKANGLGNEHPAVKAKVSQLEGLKGQIDEAIVNLRATLQAQLERASEQLKSVDVMNIRAREEAIKRGLDAQDYVDAKRDFETEQELLQQMKLKLQSLPLKNEADAKPAAPADGGKSDR
jgi:beta-lactamase regulating signal transducer with metallopeptidase domain